MDEPKTRAERRAATAARILDAAQIEFGVHGIDGATVRGIARRAGVDPSLVLQHYGSKDSLFTLAVHPAPGLTEADVPEHLGAVLDARLHELPPATRALLRSMLTSPAAASVMRTYLEERIENLAGASDRDDARLRAAIVVSSIMGMTLARHLLELDDLVDVDGDRLAAIVEPWFATIA